MLIFKTLFSLNSPVLAFYENRKCNWTELSVCSDVTERLFKSNRASTQTKQTLYLDVMLHIFTSKARFILLNAIQIQVQFSKNRLYWAIFHLIITHYRLIKHLSQTKTVIKGRLKALFRSLRPNYKLFSFFMQISELAFLIFSPQRVSAYLFLLTIWIHLFPFHLNL